MKLSLLTGIGSIVLFLGCGNPADNVPAAAVSSNTNAPAAAANQAEGKYYSFNTNSSSIEFVGSKVTGKHEGGFRNFSGEFHVVDGKVANRGNKIVIDTTSLYSDNDRLTGHLKTPDFFDVAKYPSSTFVSTKVNQNGTNSTVTGNLTLHGVTKQIEFPANIQVTSDGVSVSSEFYLKRFDFEMKYPGKADDLIREEVVIRLNIKATPGRATVEVIENRSGSVAVRG